MGGPYPFQGLKKRGVLKVSAKGTVFFRASRRCDSLLPKQKKQKQKNINIFSSLNNCSAWRQGRKLWCYLFSTFVDFITHTPLFQVNGSDRRAHGSFSCPLSPPSTKSTYIKVLRSSCFSKSEPPSSSGFLSLWTKPQTPNGSPSFTLQDFLLFPPHHYGFIS